MKSIFYLCICVGFLFAQPNFETLESEVNSAAVSVKNLNKQDMKAVKKKEYELLNLKKKLGKIKTTLGKKDILNNLKLNSFRVTLKEAFDEKDEHKNVASGIFRQGDVLEFSSTITYPKLEEKATTTLEWQLFYENGNPVENYSKEKDFDFINTSKSHKFKIRLEQTLSSGKYKVALTHYLKQNDKIRYQAVKSFQIKQDIQITNLQLSNSPTDTKNRTKFYHDENPHMYVNFKLSTSIKKVDVAFNAINQKGEVLYEYEGERKRKGKSQRAGIKISDLKAGDKVTFNALLRGSDGYEVSQSKSFVVRYYNLDIIANFNTLAYNETRSFKLKVPKEFTKPYKVMNLINSKIYYTRINNSTLKGTLSATNNSGYEKFEFMKFTVIDSKGREAVNVHSMSIKPKEKEVVVQKIHVPKPKIKKKVSKGKKYLDTVCGIDTSKYSKWNGWEHNRGFSLKTKTKTFKQHQYKYFTKQCLLYESHLIDIFGHKTVTYWNKPATIPSKNWKTGAKNMMMKYDLNTASRKELVRKEWNTVGVLKFHRKNGKVIFDK